MLEAPIPSNESERLASLQRLNLLDTPPEDRFDRITKIATLTLQVPISTVTLVDSNREWFKSVCGLDNKEGERAISFCGHAMLSEKDVFIIPDAKEDSRFHDNPMVIGKPYIRFYAGVPLISIEGQRIGTFCVKAHEPKHITENEVFILQGLAAWAELEINVHNAALALDSVNDQMKKLNSLNKMMVDRELKMIELKKKLKEYSSDNSNL